MKKKSQAALEFLTTYVWAFVVIAVTLGALYYFGIFDFGKYLPEKCNFPSQFKCIDFSLAPTRVGLKLTNNLGEDISVTSIQVTNEATPPVSCTLTSPSGTPFGWDAYSDKEMNFSCSGGGYIADSRAELLVSMNYYAINTPSQPIHSINGKINGQVTT